MLLAFENFSALEKVSTYMLLALEKAFDIGKSFDILL